MYKRQVRALATYPTYDPKAFDPLRADSAAAVGALLNDPTQPLLNRATQGACLLYTSDAADERSSVDLGGRRIIKKKKIEVGAVSYKNLRAHDRQYYTDQHCEENMNSRREIKPQNHTNLHINISA